jgi:hypothetical protein
MDQDTFTKLVQMLHYLHLGASEVAAAFVAPLLLVGALGGFFLVRWIFRGGLSRCASRVGEIIFGQSLQSHRA